MADLPERLAPIKACSAVVRLLFDGMTLRLYEVGGMKSYAAVSGKLGADFSLKAQQSRGLVSSLPVNTGSTRPSSGRQAGGRKT